jgi:hypothetical protein
VLLERLLTIFKILILKYHIGGDIEAIQDQHHNGVDICPDILDSFMLPLHKLVQLVVKAKLILLKDGLETQFQNGQEQVKVTMVLILPIG